MADIERLSREVMHELNNGAADMKAAMNTVLDRHNRFYEKGLRSEIAKSLATWRKRHQEVVVEHHVQEPPTFPRIGSTTSFRERRHYLDDLENRRDEVAEHIKGSV